MLDEELTKITDSMQEKLGKENSAIIADDIGMLITSNKNTQDALFKANEEIKSLKSDKEKLVLANGNLLKQIPMESDTTEVQPKDEPVQHFNLRDAFDEKGNFKR